MVINGRVRVIKKHIRRQVITMKRILLIVPFLFLVSYCTQAPKEVSLSWGTADTLSVAVSNNAVASANVGETTYLYSFMGLKGGTSTENISSYATRFNISAENWEEIPAVPGNKGRLGSTAQNVNGKIYLFGGYTVANNGEEESTRNVYRYDPVDNTYEEMSPMLLPVEDAVSLTYEDRYIYLVSGWNNTNNVSNVQVYDTETNSWYHATPYPGPPVFGHSGGISGNTMILSDGVEVIIDEGERLFRMSPGSIQGIIDADDPTTIHWSRIKQHPGKARYRMAAIGVEQPVPMVIFAGGTTNPYNYNGIGYNGQTSFPMGDAFAYRLDTQQWVDLGTMPAPSMDHRGIAEANGQYYIIGGLTEERNPSSLMQKFSIELSAEH